MAELRGNVEDLAKNIKLLAFDVDGVMTDGSVTYDENGVEYKTFNVKDGHGIVRANKSGFITAIITARNNGTVQHRAENLNITEIYQGQKYKLPALEGIKLTTGSNISSTFISTVAFWIMISVEILLTLTATVVEFSA